jgi:hypothetical protein
MKNFKIKLIVCALLFIFAIPTLSFGWSVRYGNPGYGGRDGHHGFNHHHGVSNSPHYGIGHGEHWDLHSGFSNPQRFGPHPGWWYKPHRFGLHWR